MRIDADYIRKSVGWQRVIEDVADGYHRFDIIPDNKDAPKAYIAFSVYEGSYAVLQYGFGEWHAHVYDGENERRGIVKALRVIAEIVSGRRYVIEERSQNGKLRSTSTSLVGRESSSAPLTSDSAGVVMLKVFFADQDLAINGGPREL